MTDPTGRTAVDIFDTQIWIYIATEQYDWAADLFEELLAGDRIVYLTRYIATEFYDVMLRNQGVTGQDMAWEFLQSLWEIPAVIMPHPNSFRVDVEQRRQQAETQALAAICEMEPKDVPIVADAYRLAEFVGEYNPPEHPRAAIPQDPEEFRLARLLHDADVSEIIARIQTYEREFVGRDLAKIGLEGVDFGHIA